MGLLAVPGFFQADAVASHWFLAPGMRFHPFRECASRFFRVAHQLGATRAGIPSYGFAPLQGFLLKALPDTSRCEHLS
jgi:hypothetical protein